MSKYKAYDEQIKIMHADGKRNSEIAIALGLDSRRVSDRLRVNNLKKNWVRRFDNVSKTQQSILIGSAMGDGCFFRSTENSTYRFMLAHSLQQEEYFMMKYKALENLINSKPKRHSIYHKRVNKTYHDIRFQSLVNPYYSEIYEKWYEDGVKAIKKENIHEIDELALAIKYFDDGYHVRGGGAIAMSGFSDDSVNNLVSVFERLGIKVSTWADKTIYITRSEFPEFKKIVMPYATSDVLYKLGEFRETPNANGEGDFEPSTTEML